tara:strand:- start:282 stop:1070 length:789 start_codon:yes stop_codon:yes gene_type:complete
MIKVSHELPNNMLHMSKEINDYEYCLPHLLDFEVDYLDHFLKAKKDGKYIIMDNSLHELGKAYAEDRLMHWIKELKPNEFIVPDVWQDMTTTLVNAKRWSNIELPEKVTKVAVVQANNYGEAIECYSILKTHHRYHKIAFSYGADWYADMFPHPNSLVGKMMGRIMTISKMYKDNIISKSDRVHLLGCALPQEFSYYKDFPFIESLDTSNPIIHGLKGIKYKHYGLLTKDTTKIDTLEEIKLTPDVLYNINHNLTKFKQFLK